MGKRIALLRGINVSGQKTILMADLKTLFESLGFREVVTYIQSGNVVFEAGKATDAKLAGAIEKAIEKKYGFDVTVIVRSPEELEAALKKNPFAKVKLAGKMERVYIAFLSESPAKEAVKELAKALGGNDEVAVLGREAFILVRDGIGKSVFTNNFLEKKLGVRATTRNMETTRKLLELGSPPE